MITNAKLYRIFIRGQNFSYVFYIDLRIKNEINIQEKNSDTFILQFSIKDNLNILSYKSLHI